MTRTSIILSGLSCLLSGAITGGGLLLIAQVLS